MTLGTKIWAGMAIKDKQQRLPLLVRVAKWVLLLEALSAALDFSISGIAPNRQHFLLSFYFCDGAFFLLCMLGFVGIQMKKKWGWKAAIAVFSLRILFVVYSWFLHCYVLGAKPKDGTLLSSGVTVVISAVFLVLILRKNVRAAFGKT